MRNLFNKSRFYLRQKKAFTLVELLVVVLIVGILSAIALPQYQRAVENTRASEAFAILNSIAEAEEMYVLQNGFFTPDFSSLVLQIPVEAKTKTAAGEYSYGVGDAFDYDISECEYNDCTISALRGQENNHPYEIRLSGIGHGGSPVRTCHATEEKGVEVCLSLCAVDTMPTGGSCLIQ